LVLWGYIDDSRKDNTLVLSCVVAEHSVWFWLEVEWQRVLAKKNAELAAAGRQTISRYHAADCSNCRKEFEGWDVQKEQIPFVAELLAVVYRHRLNVIAYSIDVNDVARHIPGADSKPDAMAHVIILGYILKGIADNVLGEGSGATLGIVHDRGSYDAVFRNTFNAFIGDADFPSRKRFSSIDSMSSVTTIPLQVADLMAYENLKEVTRHEAGRDRRKSLSLILSEGLMGGFLKGINEETVIEYVAYLNGLPDALRVALLEAGHIKKPVQT
jgi:hypothetical protein